MDNIQQTQISFIDSKCILSENKMKTVFTFSLLKSICKPAFGNCAHTIREYLLLQEISDPGTHISY